MKQFRRIIFTIMCIAVLCAGVVASAAESDEIQSVTWVSITEDGFVADSLYGVDAIYNLNGPTLYCTNYVERYYDQVYGLSIICTADGITVSKPGYWFEESTVPSVGDVLYASAEARGKYAHWAVVKSVNDDGTITLIEQNWRWNGQAGVDRIISWPSDYYVLYTLNTVYGAPKPIVDTSAYVTIEETARPLATYWAQAAVDAAAEYGFTLPQDGLQADVTREQFCQLAVELVNLTGHASFTPQRSVEDASFCAVAYDMGILKGGLDGSLLNDQSLTREQASTILSRLMTLVDIPTEVTPLTFADTADIQPWAAQSVAALNAAGIIKGDTAGNFNPQGTLSFEAAVVMMVRMMELI